MIAWTVIQIQNKTYNNDNDLYLQGVPGKMK